MRTLTKTASVSGNGGFFRVRKGFPSSAEGSTYNRKAAEKSGMSEPAGIHSAHKSVEYSADSIPSPVTSAEGKYVSPSAEPKKENAA